MSGQKTDKLGAEGRLREIQASIMEGRMMLQVLRSLPASENNNAFITRFEELVSRLEKYKADNNHTQSSEIQSQLDTLREKQENIRQLLSRTAEDFQAVLSPGLQLPGSSQQTSEQISNSAVELLSKFSSLVPDGDVMANGEGVAPINNVVPQQNGEEVGIRGTTEQAPNASVASANVLNEAVDTTDSTVPVLNSQAKWAPLFAIQVTKLTDLIDDSKRFESMVERLLDITRRARLTEASQFLSDIVVRFHELQRSFTSLRDSYEALGNDSQQSDESRTQQLSGLQEFLEKLEQNMETTKECFFTVYHLVKTNIEHNMADGSLCEAPEDEDDAVQPSNVNGTVTSLATDQPTSDTTTHLVASPNVQASLDVQKAHLAALQNQTLAEREEIGRLLKQRDGLADRLRTLRAAALSASQAVDREVEAEAEEADTAPVDGTAPSGSGDAQLESDMSPFEALGLDPTMLAQLEAKRRELSDLRAQLALLRKAEQQMATLTTSGLAALNDNEEDENSSESSVRRERSHRPSPSPLSSAIRSGLADRTSSRHSDVGVGTTGSTTLSAPQKLDTVTFQQPEATCITDSTKLLYDNMREARIRLEAYRDKGAPSVGEATNLKHLIQSAAASQDRTTLATWGGSSLPSSSAGSSGAGPDKEEHINVSVPRTSEASQTFDVPVSKHVPLSASDTPKSASVRSTTTKPTPRQPDLSPRSAFGDVLRPNLLQPEGGNFTMPQLGRSPSPPRRNLFTAGQNVGTQVVSDASKGFTMVDGSTELLGVAAETGSMLPPLSCAIEQRVTRLETTLSQLCQLYRFLQLENQQLRLAMTNLLLHQGRVPQPIDLTASDPNALISGLLSSSSSVCPTPTGFSSTSYASMPLGVPYPAQSNVMLVNTDHKEPSLPAQSDNLQASFAQLMQQQQMQYLQLQQQVQRLLQLQQSGTNKPLGPLQQSVPLSSQRFLSDLLPSNQLATSLPLPMGFARYSASTAVDPASVGISWPVASLPNVSFPGFAGTRLTSAQSVPPATSGTIGVQQQQQQPIIDQYGNFFPPLSSVLDLSGVQPDANSLLSQMLFPSNSNAGRDLI